MIHLIKVTMNTSLNSVIYGTLLKNVRRLNFLDKAR